MKLPKESFRLPVRIAFTFLLAYAGKLCIDGLVYAVLHIGVIARGLGNFISCTRRLLSPAPAGIAIAYLLDPLVNSLQAGWEWLMRKQKKQNKYRPDNELHEPAPEKSSHEPVFRKRLAGAVLTYGFIIGIVAVITALLLHTVGKDGSGSFFSNIRFTAASTMNELSDFHTRLQITLDEWGVLDYLSAYIAQAADAVTNFISRFTLGAMDTVASVGNAIPRALMALLLAFYFITNKEALLHRIRNLVNRFIPAKRLHPVLAFVEDANHIFFRYIRGQLLDATVMAALISTYLSCIGVPFAVVIGIFSGYSNIIPYFGAVVGFALSVLAAVLSGEPLTILYAAVGVLLLQGIDSAWIAPRIVGHSVRLSTLTVLIALTIGNRLAGLLGLILAVPVCGILKMLMLKVFHKQDACSAEM